MSTPLWFLSVLVLCVITHWFEEQVMSTTKTGRWLSVDETIAYVNRVRHEPITATTLVRWLDQGLQHTLISGRILRIYTDDLDDWLADRLEPDEWQRLVELVRHPPAASKNLRRHLARKR